MPSPAGSRPPGAGGLGRGALLALVALGALAGAAPAGGDGETAASVPARDETLPPGHRRMVTILEYVASIAEDDNRFVGQHDLRAHRATLERLPQEAPPDLRVATMVALAGQMLRVGQNEEAIEVLEATQQLVQRLRDPLQQAEVSFRLGVAWMRVGEVANCVACRGGDSCVFPIAGGGVHVDPRGSQNALRCFVETLLHTRAAPTSSLHLSARWLLNVVAMTLGKHPEAVPERYRIDPAAIGGEAGFPALPDVAQELGLDLEELAGGCAVDDFNGDGIPDVLTSTSDPRGSLRLHRGTPEGAFVEVTREVGLDALVGGGLHLVPADYDGDGDLDVLVPRGAWLQERGRHPTSLVRNDGTRFTDVTFEAGLGAACHPSQVAAWADYDNDGDLDLFLGSEAFVANPYPCRLFRSRGDGTFEDVAAAAGVTNDAFTKGAAWGDYDGDRWPDLYVSNLGGANRLYKNRGDGTFEDVAPRLGITGPAMSFPCWFWDYDNDGNLDLFVASYEEDVGAFVAARLGLPHQGTAAALYRGDGKGGFEDVAPLLGLALPTVAMGAGFGDVDGDGFLDVYIGTGFPGYEGLVPNLLLRNDAGRAFVNVTAASRTGKLQKGHGISFADVDRDGDEDIYARFGGALLADGFASSLFLNPGAGDEPGRAWLSVRLVGTRSNRSAVGARITARFEDGGTPRQVVRWVGQTSSFGHRPLAQLLGLGRATSVDLEVHWPTSDTTQRFAGLPVRAHLEITEGTDEPRTLELPPLPVGGPR